MSVHAPGRVDRGASWRRQVGLGRAIARALPSSAPHGGGRRSITAGLSMTSMIDVLVVMTVFLLLTFSASDHSSARDLPPAVNTADLMDAPVIDVRADAVMVEGRVVATSGELSSFSTKGQVVRLEGLFTALKAKHELALQLSPGHEPPTHVILAIDGDVPAALVKSVVMTAARSGYPSIDFMVQAAPRG